VEADDTIPMIRISITQAAFDAIAATMPLGTVAYEADLTNLGNYFIWLEERWITKLRAQRGPGKSHSDVIIRLAAVGR
jgi:hypothetical protein